MPLARLVVPSSCANRVRLRRRVAQIREPDAIPEVFALRCWKIKLRERNALAAAGRAKNPQRLPGDNVTLRVNDLSVPEDQGNGTGRLRGRRRDLLRGRGRLAECKLRLKLS